MGVGLVSTSNEPPARSRPTTGQSQQQGGCPQSEEVVAASSATARQLVKVNSSQAASRVQEKV